MEFTKHFAQLSKLERLLLEKGEGYLDVGEVEDFKSQIERAELEARQKLLRKKYPIRSFFIFDSLPIGLTCIALSMGVDIITQHSVPWLTLSFFGLGLFFCVFRFIPLTGYRDTTPWREGLFDKKFID